MIRVERERQKFASLLSHVFASASHFMELEWSASDSQSDS